ncbi:hypothetical protein GW796_07460 [archaeon]|nr:hypothetical protein [archaeon]NCQ51720.1 hypothetical protein [archaeon]
MNYIRIDDLTDNQMKHADVMWYLEDIEEIEFYMLPIVGKDWVDAQIALHMLRAESLDDIQLLPMTKFICNHYKY